MNQFLPAHLNLNDNDATKLPALLYYMLSILCKAVINSFINNCLLDIKAAEPFGIMTVQIFALDQFQFKRNVPAGSGQPKTASLISILLSKYHATAPILFGIVGDEKTRKARMGWRAEPHGDSKAYVPEQQQYDRLAGLGAGYAAISLRNFSKSGYNNPYPPVHFWKSLAHIVNLDPRQMQPSYLLLLKNMLENSLDRIVLFFGATGIAALRLALVELPRKLPSELANKAPAQSLNLLLERWGDQKKFHLD